MILGFRRWAPRIPGPLVAVVGATIVSSAFHLAATAGISVVGPLPQGLPAFQIPAVSLGDVRALFLNALAIALVSFADMSVLSRTFALRGRYEVDANQELIALGAANVAAGFFQGFPITSSSSRTPVAEAAGAKTQLTGVVGAACIALLLIFGPRLLADLPHAALGAVVISACLGLVEVSGVLRLWRLRPGEFVLSIVCFLGVALFGVIEGIFIAVGLALLDFVWRAWRPYDAVLGRVDGLRWLPRHHPPPRSHTHPGPRPVPVGRAALLRQRRDVPRARPPRGGPGADADEVGRRRRRARDRHRHHGRRSAGRARQGAGGGRDRDLFRRDEGPVKDRLKRYGLFAKLGAGNFFPTIEQAVDAYLARHGAGPRDESFVSLARLEDGVSRALACEALEGRAKPGPGGGVGAWTWKSDPGAPRIRMWRAACAQSEGREKDEGCRSASDENGFILARA